MSTVDANALRWWKSSRSGGQGGDCVEVATMWRKSSRSGGEGGNCVEVANAWRKSSHSGGQGGECVEVADDGGRWFVRDSKDPAGGMLSVSGIAWHAFLDRVRADASLKETAHLLRSPANARRLLSSIERLEAGRGTRLDLVE